MKYVVLCGMQLELVVNARRRKSDQSDPDWLVQLELSRRVSAAHRAAEQCLTRANRAMHTLEEVLRALTHMVNVLPITSRVGPPAGQLLTMPSHVYYYTAMPVMMHQSPCLCLLCSCTASTIREPQCRTDQLSQQPAYVSVFAHREIQKELVKMTWVQSQRTP